MSPLNGHHQTGAMVKVNCMHKELTKANNFEKLSRLNEDFFFTEQQPDPIHYSNKKIPNKSRLFRRKSISKWSWGVSAFVGC